MADVFVFGSNLAGRHGKGAALEARKHWGAKYGVGEGRSGKSYAIPTKDEKLRTRSLEDIKISVDKFLEYARNSEKVFWVTPVGCGLAGYKPAQIAPMFKDRPYNVVLPKEFKEVLNES